MASADHLRALIESHLDGDDKRFVTVAMQVASHEARSGHGKLAEELRALIDRAKARGIPEIVPLTRPRGEVADLLAASHPKTRLTDIVLDDGLTQQIRRVLREQRHASQILEKGLAPRRKLLLVGPPGTGKTLTASVLAGELGLPLMQVRLDVLITKFMGETAAKLRNVFDTTGRIRGVYFFDEFDAIGSRRSTTNDVGEVRRILNSFLQMLEQDQSHSLIVAATNHRDLLDAALFRRFDDVLQYTLPTEEQIADMLKDRLTQTSAPRTSWKKLADRAKGLSYAEVTRAIEDVLKEAIIAKNSQLPSAAIARIIEERQSMAHHWKDKQ